MLLMALGLVETGSDDEVTTSNLSIVEDTQKVSTSLDGDMAVQDGAPDLIWSFLSKQLGGLIAGQCHSTYSLQPLYYHIGCAFFLLAFLAPSHRYGAALYMRCMLVFGCVLFVMWSYLTECRPDVMLWSGTFILANLIHMAILICKLRPVKFDKDIEEVSNHHQRARECHSRDIWKRVHGGTAFYEPCSNVQQKRSLLTMRRAKGEKREREKVGNNKKQKRNYFDIDFVAQKKGGQRSFR